MSGPGLGSNLILRDNTRSEFHRAAIRIADQIAAEHPHPFDDLILTLAGRELGQDPAIRDEVLNLIDVVFGDQKPRRKP